MYVGQFTFSLRFSFEIKAASEALDNLLSALRMNGQICGREFPVAVTPDGYTAMVLLPESSASNASNHNRYVRDCLQKLHAIGLTEPDCEIAEDIDGDDACDCETPSRYILYTTYL